MTWRKERWSTGLGLVATVGLLLGACGGGDQPPAAGDTLGFDGSPAPSPEGGVGADGGAAGDAGGSGADSAGFDAIADGRADVTIDAPPLPPDCTEGYTWGSTRQWTADPIARFGGVSGTGLTISWTRTNGEIVVADRPGANGDFYPPVILPAETLQPLGRVALDPGGLLLVGVAPSGTDFVVLERSSMADVLWMDTPPLVDGSPGVPYSAAFAPIQAAAVQAGATVTEPVLSGSGLSFFYLLTPSAFPTVGAPDGGDDGGDAASADAAVDAPSEAEAAAPLPVPTGPPVLYESRWNAGAMQWATGVAVTAMELVSMDATHRRRPTGVSADDRTLFFYDEVANVQRAAWRADVGGAFTHFEDVAAAPEAAPNAGCTVLFYRGQSDAGTQGVFGAQ